MSETPRLVTHVGEPEIREGDIVRVEVAGESRRVWLNGVEHPIDRFATDTLNALFSVFDPPTIEEWDSFPEGLTDE